MWIWGEDRNQCTWGRKNHRSKWDYPESVQIERQAGCWTQPYKNGSRKSLEKKLRRGQKCRRETWKGRITETGVVKMVKAAENLGKMRTEVFLGFYPKAATRSLGRTQSGCDEVAIWARQWLEVSKCQQLEVSVLYWLLKGQEKKNGCKDVNLRRVLHTHF